MTTAPSADLVSIIYTKHVVSPECGWVSACEFTYSYYIYLYLEAAASDSEINFLAHVFF